MGHLAQGAASLPASLDGAAEELQASIDRYVFGLLRGAELRASSIEEYATRSIDRGTTAAMSHHAARMLEAIDSLDGRINERFRELRDEAERLLRELERVTSVARPDGSRGDIEAGSGLDLALAELLALDELPTSGFTLDLRRPVNRDRESIT